MGTFNDNLFEMMCNCLYFLNALLLLKLNWSLTLKKKMWDECKGPISNIDFKSYISNNIWSMLVYSWRLLTLEILVQFRLIRCLCIIFRWQFLLWRVCLSAQLSHYFEASGTCKTYLIYRAGNVSCVFSSGDINHAYYTMFDNCYLYDACMIDRADGGRLYNMLYPQ